MLSWSLYVTIKRLNLIGWKLTRKYNLQFCFFFPTLKLGQGHQRVKLHGGSREAKFEDHSYSLWENLAKKQMDIFTGVSQKKNPPVRSETTPPPSQSQPNHQPPTLSRNGKLVADSSYCIDQFLLKYTAALLRYSAHRYNAVPAHHQLVLSCITTCICSG